MTITKRLFITLSIALLGMLLVGGYGIWQLTQAQSRFNYVQVNTFPSLKDMTDALSEVADMRVATLKILLARSPQERDTYQAVVDDADKKFDAIMADYLANDISNDTDRQLLEADKAAMASYRALRDKALAQAHAGNLNQAIQTLFVDAHTVATEMAKNLGDHYKFNTDLATELGQQNNQQYNQSLLLLSVIVAGAFLASGLLAAHLFRIIRGGLTDIQNTLEHVSLTLDFTQRATVVRKDEIGGTASAFNHLLERLQQSLLSLFAGAQEVGKASQSLSQTASEVSSASSSQSEAAANMAATVEQMTVSVNHVADQAKLTHAGATEASKLVGEGSSIIGQTIRDIREISSAVKTSASSIHELETYSAQVSAVINVIRDIADQTNLLALNAAIEAARAGEMGRGFAVVADEVRKLAERTSRSTQEISSTIETMVGRAQQATVQMKAAEQLVETSVSRADNADHAIQRIGVNAAAAAQSISEISAAIQQQGVASNNIASQVEHTAQMSEESSAAAQHTAQSAVHLDQLAKSQIATLSQFKI
jgi:methyl-accepting chemotaxis protein